MYEQHRNIHFYSYLNKSFCFEENVLLSTFIMEEEHFAAVGV